MKTLHLAILLVSVIFLLKVIPALGEDREAALYYVNYYGDDGRCSGSDLSWGDNVAGNL